VVPYLDQELLTASYINPTAEITRKYEKGCQYYALPFNPGENELLTTLQEQINPKVAAVLVIDMQNDYVADRGLLAEEGKNVKRVQKMVPKLNLFIEGAREAG